MRNNDKKGIDSENLSDDKTCWSLLKTALPERTWVHPGEMADPVFQLGFHLGHYLYLLKMIL